MGPNPQPPGHQSDVHPTEPTRPVTSRMCIQLSHHGRQTSHVAAHIVWSHCKITKTLTVYWARECCWCRLVWHWFWDINWRGSVELFCSHFLPEHTEWLDRTIYHLHVLLQLKSKCLFNHKLITDTSDIHVCTQFCRKGRIHENTFFCFYFQKQVLYITKQHL